MARRPAALALIFLAIAGSVAAQASTSSPNSSPSVPAAADAPASSPTSPTLSASPAAASNATSPTAAALTPDADAAAASGDLAPGASDGVGNLDPSADGNLSEGSPTVAPVANHPSGASIVKATFTAAAALAVAGFFVL